MRIYKYTLVNRQGRQIGEIENYDTLHGVSTLMWAEDIPHATKLSSDCNKTTWEELEIEVRKDTLDKLLKNFIITVDEYQEIYHNEVDFITLI